MWPALLNLCPLEASHDHVLVAFAYTLSIMWHPSGSVNNIIINNFHIFWEHSHSWSNLDQECNENSTPKMHFYTSHCESLVPNWVSHYFFLYHFNFLYSHWKQTNKKQQHRNSLTLLWSHICFLRSYFPLCNWLAVPSSANLGKEIFCLLHVPWQTVSCVKMEEGYNRSFCFIFPKV